MLNNFIKYNFIIYKFRIREILDLLRIKDLNENLKKAIKGFMKIRPFRVITVSIGITATIIVYPTVTGKAVRNDIEDSQGTPIRREDVMDHIIM